MLLDQDTAPLGQTGRIFVTGGTGFVGSSIVKAIGDHPTRLLKRKGETRLGAPSEVWSGDVTDTDSLTGSMDGCDVVIHLVGIIEETGGVTFDRVIRVGTENVIAEAHRAGVNRFILMSALGAQDNPSLPYQQAKFRAEQAMKASGMSYTIFRPSVIFGPGDSFITVLANVVRSFPVVPVVGDGKTKFQPVHVNDVADSFAATVNRPEDTTGQTYELGGLRSYTYEEMLDLIAGQLGKSKPKVHVPLPLMKAVVGLSAPLPRSLRPPVSSEQLKMLGLDNSTDRSATEKLIRRSPQDLATGIGYLNTVP